MDNLRPRTRQVGHPHQLKKPPLEERVSAGVHQQLVQSARAPPAWAAQRGEALDKDDR
jgi:hypothetical protein